MSLGKKKSLSEILVPGESLPKDLNHWKLDAFSNEDCLSYIVWNEKSKEALFIDPKMEDQDAYHSLIATLPKDLIWLAVVDTHTHADHISNASAMAEFLQVPLLMHEISPTKRVHLRVCRDTLIPARAGAIRLIPTPGHTPDGISVLWGPFLFSGDTVLYGDVGRDDLPGGDGSAHYESLQKLKEILPPETLVLPGHDFKGGRVSSWKTQLEVNSSLTQGREDFVREATEFDAPAPKLLKKSLAENFK